jgi:hypothetical protein
MKTYCIALCLLLTLSASAQEAKSSEKVNGPVLTLEKTTHDFGDIYQGDRVEHVFKFTNTGNEPLIIQDIRITCGCTQPEWPRQPIMPGGKGEIKVGFNSAGKMGLQNKSLPVISNAMNDVAITFTTNVLAKNPQ